MKTIKVFWKKEEGVSLVVGAILLTALLGFLGLAMDVGNLVYTKTCMQSAVDAGALAGALALPNQTTATTQAATFVNNNLQTHGLPSVTPTVSFTQDPNNKNPNNYPEINVKISQNVPTYIMKVLSSSLSTFLLTASAEAVVKSGSTGPFTYSIFSNTSLTIPGSAFNITGSVHANTTLTFSNGAYNISNNVEGVTGVSLSGAGNLGSVGTGTGGTITEGGAFNNFPEYYNATDIPLSNYNYTSQIEQTAGTTITPPSGTYTQSGALNISGNLYVNGNVILNGAINDTGAILASGNITVSGAANIGGNGQVFLYSANGNIQISGAQNFGTSGNAIIYAPNGTISFGPGGVAANFNGALIANEITLPTSAFNVTGGYPITAINLASHAQLIN